MAKKETANKKAAQKKAAAKKAAPKKTPVARKTATPVAAKKAAKKAAPAKKSSAMKKTATPSPAKRAAAKRTGASTEGARQAGSAKPAVTTPESVSPAPIEPVTPVPAQAKKTTGGPVTTTVVAKVDVGFGNSLYLRGSGAGLSWERGVPFECAASDEWVWSSTAPNEQFEAKVLLNDEIWSEGENLVITPGEKSVIEPSF